MYNVKIKDKIESHLCLGDVPLWLNGSIIRNGPGEFDIGEESFKHWFDGHALIHKYA